MNNLTVDFEPEDQSPRAQQITLWLQNTLNQLIPFLNTPTHSDKYPAIAKKIVSLFTDFHVSIIFVSSEKSQSLNHQYRHKNSPTNILSFPSAIPLEFYQHLPKEEQQFTLGDLVVDLNVIQQEAKVHHKSLDDHLTHILIHGLLHLFHFDHELSDEAAIMENLEIQLLMTMGIQNPYE